MYNMKIDVFSICYNEAFLLPHFIKHYQSPPFNANITIYDNRSIDNSREIITSNGCNLIDYNSQEEIRDDLYLKIKNSCWYKSKAEFVIICDIDEFLELPVNADLSKCSIIKTKGYDMIGPPPSRLGVQNKMYDKLVMFRPNQIQGINYKAGAHVANPVGNVIYSSFYANLLHYKYISEDYVFNRHKMYEKRLSNINKSFQWGIEYQDVQKEKIEEKFRELKEKATLVPNQ